jgi:hypothetical protein
MMKFTALSKSTNIGDLSKRIVEERGLARKEAAATLTLCSDIAARHALLVEQQAAGGRIHRGLTSCM